jgi:hypothetical protein
MASCFLRVLDFQDPGAVLELVAGAPHRTDRRRIDPVAVLRSE